MNKQTHNSNVKEISVEWIIPDPNQPRKNFDDESLRELAASIEQHGLLEPILVRPVGNGRFQIVHGERRFRACKLLGLKIIRAEVRELTDNQVLEIQLVENIQRENLNPLDEAETFYRMVKELDYTHEEIAKRIGKSREYVTNKPRLLKLSSEVQDKVRKGIITEAHARAILSLNKIEEQKQLTNAIINQKLSVKETEQLARSLKSESDNVSRETMDVPVNGLVIGVWVSEEVYQKLSDMAKSKGTTVESFCSKIVEEVAKNVG
jgi:ParB family chromosome partitioning protein